MFYEFIYNEKNKTILVKAQDAADALYADAPDDTSKDSLGDLIQLLYSIEIGQSFIFEEAEFHKYRTKYLCIHTNIDKLFMCFSKNSDKSQIDNSNYLKDALLYNYRKTQNMRIPTTITPTLPETKPADKEQIKSRVFQLS